MATFCKEKNLASITYIEHPFDYTFRDMLNRIKIVLYKCKKDLIEKRKVYSAITQKTEALFVLRKEIKPITKDFKKYADLAISNSQNTFLAA